LISISITDALSLFTRSWVPPKVLFCGVFFIRFSLDGTLFFGVRGSRRSVLFGRTFWDRVQPQFLGGSFPERDFLLFSARDVFFATFDAFPASPH